MPTKVIHGNYHLQLLSKLHIQGINCGICVQTHDFGVLTGFVQGA